MTEFHRQTPVDLVVFSGDLAFAAQPDEFGFARRALLDPLQDALGLDRERLILAPGNHDVDISKIEKYQEKGLLAGLTSRDAVNRLLDGDGPSNYLERMEPWLAFHADYYDGTAVRRHSPLVTEHRITVDGVEVAVACLTSAWRATGEGDDADRAHLIVGDRQAAAAADGVGDAGFKIAVMHHPLDWLSDFDRRDVSRELGRFDVLCTGHVHRADPLGVTGAAGSLLHSAAGSLYQSRDHPNAYSVIDTDPAHAPKSFTVHVRSYFDGRDAFAEGVDVVSGGKQHITLGEPVRPGSVTAPGATTPGEPAATRTSADLAAEWLLDAVRERSLLLGPDRWQQDMDELLVPPVLLPVPLDQYLALAEAEEGGKLKPDDLMTSLPEFRHFVIVGDEYSGLTSALQWLSYAAYRREAQCAPVVIDFNAVEQGPNGVEREVRKQLAMAGVGVGKRDPLPRMALAVDNVDPRADKRFRHLLKFMAQQPQNTYFFGSRTAASHRLCEEIGREGPAVRTRYIGLFGRRELRALVRMVRPEEPEAEVTEMLDLLSRGGLPRTPAMLAALVSLAGQGDWTDGINNTAILESYLGMLLGRGDTSIDRRFELDFRDLQDILSCLTEHLMLSGKDALTRMEAERFLLEYFQGLGWSEPSSVVLDALIAKRILGQRDGMIYFCQPMVRPLLAAYRLDSSAELRGLVLAGPLDHGQVIRHAAALRRNDMALLRTVNEMFRSLRSRVGDGSSDLFAARAAKDGWRGSEDAEAVLEEFWPADMPYEAPEPSAQVREDFTVMLDELKDHVDTIRAMAEVERHGDAFSRSDFEAFSEGLDLLADVLRSSELVRDLDLKRQTLQLTLNGYGVRAALMATEWKVRGIRKVFEEALAGSVDRLELTADDFDELLSRIELFSPVISSYTALSQALASGKLSKLTDEALSERDFVEQPGQALMAVLLVRRMGDRDWIRHASRVVKLHGERKVVSEVLRFFAMSSYLQSDLGREDVTALESLLADIATQRKELPSGPARGQHRTHMLQGLRNRRMRALQQQGRRWIEPV
ncbi:hypothetical protein AQJ27_20855 [Streptomyces olivochromogenes]|nr:hypothetical protein AQJ27_20855 [Streptomyces olivochromogenes]